MRYEIGAPSCAPYAVCRVVLRAARARGLMVNAYCRGEGSGVVGVPASRQPPAASRAPGAGLYSESVL
jgi:hypothetical protein